MSSTVSASQVLQLYRNLIKYGKTLKLTDQKYYLNRVREEFRSNKDQQSPEKIEFLFKKGKSLLEKKRLL